LINPIKLATSGNRYIKNIEKEIKREVVVKVCDGKLQMEKV
jgi:hypothetical protein